jgi:putative sigma-54 modulation protein
MQLVDTSLVARRLPQPQPIRPRPMKRLKETDMNFELHSKNVKMTHTLQAFIERRLRTITKRFGDRIHRVRVRLADINGPRGGEDIQCQIQASLGSFGIVTIQETRGDPFTAFARASTRASQQLKRQFSRARTDRRGR